jgi:hypothetical protein
MDVSACFLPVRRCDRVGHAATFPVFGGWSDRSAAHRRPLSRGSNPCGYPHEPLVSYRINRQLSGWIPPPLMIRAFGAHCQQRTLHECGHCCTAVQCQEETLTRQEKESRTARLQGERCNVLGGMKIPLPLPWACKALGKEKGRGTPALYTQLRRLAVQRHLRQARG